MVRGGKRACGDDGDSVVDELQPAKKVCVESFCCCHVCAHYHATMCDLATMRPATLRLCALRLCDYALHMTCSILEI